MGVVYVKGFFDYAKETIAVATIIAGLSFGIGYYVGYDYGADHARDSYKQSLEEKIIPAKPKEDITKLFE
jgi:hypothetical protein